jgi:hypothetical protein
MPPRSCRTAASYRLVLLLSLVLLGLALLLTIEWPSYTLELQVFRSPLTLTLSVVWPLIGLLTSGMAFGAVLIFRQHPVMQGEPSLELISLWPLPTLIVSLAALLLRGAHSETLRAGGIAGVGLILYSIFRLEQVCLRNGRSSPTKTQMDHAARPESWSEWTLQAMAHLLALTYFVLIYQAKLPTLLSAPTTLIVGGLLAIRLLRDVAFDWRRVGVFALVIGLVLGEATWALNYWPGPGIVGGLLLFLIFYAFVGLSRRGLEDRLTSSALVEYAAVTLLGLGLILRFG